MLRSNVYDPLPIAIGKLKETMEAHQDNILKSDINDPTSFDPVIETYHEENKYCQIIYSQFLALRKDFIDGRINLVTYRDYLKPLSELLLNQDEPIQNKYLNAGEIAAEIKKFL